MKSWTGERGVNQHAGGCTLSAALLVYIYIYKCLPKKPAFFGSQVVALTITINVHI